MESLSVDFFIYLFLISFIVRTVRNVFYHTFLWQLKEYRIDRLLSHLSTNQGKKLILGTVNLIKWFLLLVIIAGLLAGYDLTSVNFSNFGFLGLLAYFVFGFTWIFETLIYLRELFTRGWKIPVLTIKVMVILTVVIFLQFLPLLGGDLLDQLMLGPFLDKLLAPTIFFCVMVSNFPSLLYRKIYVLLAARKIARINNLKVIGITGSYGKTSTKEFLSQILSTRYKVLKTENYINTEIGVAQTILNRLTPFYDFFIVEMGAYKKGEIEAICKMVKPQIGIITGINQQHLQLFGSIENIVSAKFELISNLMQKGLAVFNSDNPWVNKMIIWSEQKRPDLEVLTYGSQEKNKLVSTDIQVASENIKFKLHYNQKVELIELPLAGEQNVINFSGATAIALKLGLKLSDIKKIALMIQPPVNTMKKMKGIRQSTFIDDSYNANPDGVVAALNYMNIFKGKKILIFTPLIELGSEADKIHKNLGIKAAQICDLILITNLNYNKSFLDGVRINSDSDIKKVQIVNTTVGTKLIEQNIDPRGVAVFEGREAGKILEKLRKSKD